MGIRDAITAVVENHDLADVAGLGWRIAQELERQCAVTVDGDYLAEAVRQLDAPEGWSAGELAEALAGIIEADHSEEG